MSRFKVHTLSPKKYNHTVLWSVILCVLIVIAAAALGRATHNFRAALTDKPDVAIYLLLPDEGVTTTSLLRESETERDYLANTKDGQKLVVLRKGPKEWYVSNEEPLHP